MTVYVDPETAARITREAARDSISAGTVVDRRFITSPTIIAQAAHTVEGLPHEFHATSSGLVRLCKHCGAGEKSAEGRTRICPNRTR